MNDFEIARDDLALDALAAGLLPDGADETLSLLHAFRTDLDEPAVVVPLRRRRRAPAAAIAAALAAAAGLAVGGVAMSNQPGQLLYTAHRVVLGGPRDSHVAEVTTLLDRAAGRLAAGDRAGARALIAQAARVLPLVPDEDRPALSKRLDGLALLAADPRPAPVPSPSPTPDRHGGGPTPEPTRTSESGDDRGGSTSTPEPSESSTSGSGSGSGSDDHSSTPSPTSSDGHDGGGSGRSGTSGGGPGPG